MWSMGRFYGSCFAFIASVMALPITAFADDEISLPSTNEIEKVWKQREVVTAKLRANWDCKRTLPKGLLDMVYNRDGKGESAPSVDTVVSEQGELVCHEKRFRFELHSAAWDPDSKQLKPTEILSLSDGKRYLHYIKKSQLSDYGTAHEHKIDERQLRESLQGACLPVTLCFRGCDELYSSRYLQEYRVTKRVRVNNRNCVELVKTNKTLDMKDTLYLDIERAYVPIRVLVQSSVRVLSQTDIDYRLSEAIGWYPISWESVNRVGNTHQVTEKASNVRISVEDVSDSDFQIPIAPKSRVVDYRGDAPKHSVVREDGTRGAEIVVPAGKMPPTYEQLVEHDGVQQAEQTTRMRVWLLLSLVGVVTLSGVCFWRWYRK